MCNWFRRVIVATSFLLALVLLPTAAKIHAQGVSVASATGRVTDPSGAVVSGAQVKITAASTNGVYGTNISNKNFYTSQSIAVAGSTGNTTNYLLDDGDNMDSFTNVNMPFSFPDALAEFSVETSVLPARNGLHPGGLVNAVTKSGSNQWHGDVFEFVRDGSENAVSFCASGQGGRPRTLQL